ncbi:MAG: hypothetical protein K2R98_15875 [Gemmataceae bacterium]|nr:hypothetical protein [Gemmataceae bacterium]
MHRINRVPRALFGGLLLVGLLLGGGAASAQKGPDEVAPPPRPAEKANTITVPVNTTYRLQLSKKQPIASVINDKPQILQVTANPEDATMVQLTGLQAGTVQLRVTAAPVGKDPPVTEVFDVIVELDIALLRNLLTRTVPTASVTPIPSGGNTVVLTGWVAHAEDIETILAIARSIGANPINAMRAGGVQQVQLDVVVARVSRTELRRFAAGVPPTSGANHFFAETSSGLFGVTAGSLVVPNTGTATVTNQIGAPNGAIANVFLSIANQRQSTFLMLQALRDNGVAKLLSEPHLVTLSGRAARLNSGGQQAVPNVSGFGGTAGVQFVDFGTTLDFLPIVLGNGKIYLEVSPTISALDAGAGVAIPGGGFVPGRIQQAVRTSVMMEDGQTFCIAGLIQHRTNAGSQRLPVLGDLPFVGAFFSNKRYSDDEEEMVVLVTPHLVDPMDCAQVPRFLPGQETRSPDDFELFLEGILEAPRGQREVNNGRRYVPAWKRHPSSQCMPCAGGGPGNVDPCPAMQQPGMLPTPFGSCPPSSSNATILEGAAGTPVTRPVMPGAGLTGAGTVQPAGGSGMVSPASDYPAFAPAAAATPVSLNVPR